MRSLSGLGIGLSVVSGCLFLALVAELCYLFWWRKISDGDMEDRYRCRACLPAKGLVQLFCWKKPHSLSFAAPDRVDVTSCSDEGQPEGKDLLLNPLRREDTVEAELMRFHGLPGPPRLLFTIKEESKEDLESEDSMSRGGRSRKGSRRKSLNDLFLSSDTPFMTPLPSPPLFSPAPTPFDCYKQSGFNPLFESSKEEDLIRMWSSPPPKFKFLKDAEEKLHRKNLMGEETGKQAYERSSIRGNSRNTGTVEGKKQRSDEESTETLLKKSKYDSSMVSPAKLQVPKARMAAERISALQQIVSPFGKTDQASVLMETIFCIKSLQEQVQLLSDPYIKSSASKDHNSWGQLERKVKAQAKVDLRSKGLCLVPISSISQDHTDNSRPDYWMPTYRSCFY